jgi:hypothetical protein
MRAPAIIERVLLIGTLATLALFLAACGDSRHSDADVDVAHQVAAAGDLVEFNYEETHKGFRNPFIGMSCFRRADGTTLIWVHDRCQHPITMDARQRRLILTELMRCGFFTMRHHHRVWFPNIGGNSGEQSCTISAVTSSGQHNDVVCTQGFPAGIEQFRHFFADLVVQEGWDRGDLTYGSLTQFAPTPAFAAYGERIMKEIRDYNGELTSLSFSDGEPSHPGYHLVMRADGSADLTTPTQAIVHFSIDADTRQHLLIAFAHGFFSIDPAHPAPRYDESWLWPVYHPTPSPPDYICDIAATTTKGMHNHIAVQGYLPPVMLELRDYLHALIADQGWDPQHPKTVTGPASAP